MQKTSYSFKTNFILIHSNCLRITGAYFLLGFYESLKYFSRMLSKYSRLPYLFCFVCIIISCPRVVYFSIRGVPFLKWLRTDNTTVNKFYYYYYYYYASLLLVEI
jgi:hypothetical protein